LEDDERRDGFDSDGDNAELLDFCDRMTPCGAIPEICFISQLQ
jgi:hypothetical protein